MQASGCSEGRLWTALDGRARYQPSFLPPSGDSAAHVWQVLWVPCLEAVECAMPVLTRPAASCADRGGGLISQQLQLPCLKTLFGQRCLLSAQGHKGQGLTFTEEQPQTMTPESLRAACE